MVRDFGRKFSSEPHYTKTPLYQWVTLIRHHSLRGNVGKSTLCSTSIAECFRQKYNKWFKGRFSVLPSQTRVFGKLETAGGRLVQWEPEFSVCKIGTGPSLIRIVTSDLRNNCLGILWNCEFLFVRHLFTNLQWDSND